jgi:hypothetical protein
MALRSVPEFAKSARLAPSDTAILQPVVQDARSAFYNRGRLGPALAAIGGLFLRKAVQAITCFQRFQSADFHHGRCDELQTLGFYRPLEPFQAFRQADRRLRR